MNGWVRQGLNIEFCSWYWIITSTTEYSWASFCSPSQAVHFLFSFSDDSFVLFYIVVPNFRHRWHSFKERGKGRKAWSKTWWGGSKCWSTPSNKKGELRLTPLVQTHDLLVVLTCTELRNNRILHFNTYSVNFTSHLHRNKHEVHAMCCGYFCNN